MTFSRNSSIKRKTNPRAVEEDYFTNPVEMISYPLSLPALISPQKMTLANSSISTKKW